MQLGDGANLQYGDVRAWVERRTEDPEEQDRLESLLYGLLIEQRRIIVAKMPKLD